MDSTFMLTYLLPNTKVDTLYINCGQGPEKVQKETDARDKLKQQFNEWYSDKSYKGYIDRDIQVEIPNVFNDITHRQKFAQPPAWLLGGVMRFDPDRHSELYIGYVHGDSILFEIEHVRKMWYHLWKLTHYGEPPRLNFYLIEQINADKLFVLENLFPSLLDKVWVCELPIWSINLQAHKSCGKCHACVVLKKAMFEYKLKHNQEYTNAMLCRRNGIHSEKGLLIHETVPKESTNSEGLDIR